MAFRIGPEGVSESKVTIYKREPVWDPDHEVVERKGKGHPDTIADTLASSISRNYARYTTQECDGQVLHHQIDKLMVIGGKTEVTWGSGKFVEPARILIAGRISRTYLERELPVDDIINESIRNYFAHQFPSLRMGHDFIVENRLTSNAGPGTIVESSGSIAAMFNPKTRGEVRGYEKLVANDTSYCLYYSPHSQLEKAILEVEGSLNSNSMNQRLPWLGSDIKIMGVRNKDVCDITICIPQIAAHVPSFNNYLHNLNSIGKEVDAMFKDLLAGHEVSISINTKDDYGKNNVYLTVSGASLSGDIGVVGRGNRTNGLISACRPMSMEGTNGKNPRYYSGFIYAVLSKRISEKILLETGQKNVVEVVSQNGGPLLTPWRINVVCDHDTKKLQNLIDKGCEEIPQITQDFLEGKIGELS